MKNASPLDREFNSPISTGRPWKEEAEEEEEEEEEEDEDEHLTFNILGRIFLVQPSLFQKYPILFFGTTFSTPDRLEKYYDRNRGQYVINMSPIVFEHILKYYRTGKLIEPSNVQLDYFKEILEKFHIDSTVLEFNERYERLVPRQTVLQLIHVLLEYADVCRFSQFLHYACSMVAITSCFLTSLSLIPHGSPFDIYIGNSNGTASMPRNKRSIVDFHHQYKSLFIIDVICLVWAIIETILRTLTTPSLCDYFISLGVFDIAGVLFQSIYIYMIGTDTKPSHCQPKQMRKIDVYACIGFHRRLMILNLFRKLRLVRYIRPLKHFVLSLLSTKREILRLLVLLVFLVAFLAPIVFILESSFIYQCSANVQFSLTRCIRTITDACYYLILIISTVGYGDVYPMSSLARFVAMLASPLSMTMLSLPLSAIYATYASTYEIYQMQLEHPDLVRYVVHDTTDTTEQQSQVQRQAIADVTARVNSNLKFFRTNQK